MNAVIRKNETFFEYVIVRFKKYFGIVRYGVSTSRSFSRDHLRSWIDQRQLLRDELKSVENVQDQKLGTHPFDPFLLKQK